MFDPTQHSHRRFNPLLGEWVLCSPHRALRPWQGGLEPTFDRKPAYDPKCYLCPGNSRVTGVQKNPSYSSTYTFTNDFPAMQLDLPAESARTLLKRDAGQILKLNRVRGTSKVICYTPHHHLTLATLPLEGVLDVVKEWKNIYTAFKAEKDTTEMSHVQIFENKGQAMGCSNPHPHGQVWASDQIPTIPQRELENMRVFQDKHGLCLLCEYSRLEASGASRVVDETDQFISVVPFWATWPFEILVVSKNHLSDIGSMGNDTLLDLAKMLQRVTTRYDNLFECDFPYSMGIHQAPLTTNSASHNGLSHFHMHFYPPLLRSASVKKWMVG